MHPVATFELVLALLGAVVALQWAAQRLGAPPAAALLLGGGALAFIPGLPDVSLDPELVLVLFLPPLLMDGAYYTALGRFRRHLPGIVSLALGAVVFTTLVVGLVTRWLVPELPWAACFALGAVVSPPDAVSARAVLQGVVIPRRLTALLEGESLLNDATGLVLFRFAVAATLSGAFDAGAAARSFLVLALGGALVGVATAAAWIFLARRIADQTLGIVVSTLLCWAAYLLGEALHVSGVIATVAAGLMLGWWQHVVFSARARLQGTAFWRVMVFVLEAMVFILIGFSLRGVMQRVGGPDAVTPAMAIALVGVVAAVTLSRFVWVFGSEALLHALRAMGLKRARPLGWRQASVLGWAGMRGVVTLAVALTLPESMPGRDFILVAAFATIVVTVVGQGSTLGWLIRRVKPLDEDPPARLSLAATEAAMARARAAAVETLAYAPDGALIHPQLLAQSRKRLAFTERYAADADSVMEGLRPHFDVVLSALAAARAELLRIHREGSIEDETLHDLERDLDVEELAVILQRGDGEG
jgi:CPA1 family monovalent cation:H+ antiporter